MAIEEQVIQPESVTNAEQPVAETASQQTQPETTVDPVKLQYEEQIKALKKELAAKEEDRLGVKRKLNEVYKEKDQQRKHLFCINSTLIANSCKCCLFCRSYFTRSFHFFYLLS